MKFQMNFHVEIILRGNFSCWNFVGFYEGNNKLQCMKFD
ncbi:hypothetical protein CAter282_3152 [Collimonas arenae]|uniref:Uncharacterized protein n=1 Tax=Collimonas arenae TaxID=279058 RepID=A0A127QLD0_9BURK|nr:hypothetical protein CAter282_3152 [Collimonas arenae]